MHSHADDMPPVDSFWSLGMYGTDLNLVANPIDRYSIGDRTAGLREDADGGLTIHLQSEAPGGEDDANWLPSPADGEFFVILRMYLPRAEVIDATGSARRSNRESDAAEPVGASRRTGEAGWPRRANPTAGLRDHSALIVPLPVTFWLTCGGLPP